MKDRIKKLRDKYGDSTLVALGVALVTGVLGAAVLNSKRQLLNASTALIEEDITDRKINRDYTTEEREMWKEDRAKQSAYWDMQDLLRQEQIESSDKLKA